MKINRMTTLFTLILFGALATTSTSQAAEHEIWTHVASSCTIDESDTAKAQVNEGRLMFAANRTETIKARCNITNPRDDGNNPEWNTFQIAYRDMDGGTNNINVKAVLKRVRNTTGTTADLFTFESSAASCLGECFKSRDINVNFDFGDFAYFIEIELRRNVVADDTPNVSVSLVRLVDVL